ncbi:MAG: archaetidylserine decarboxylase [Pseudomonadota bacterium]
MTWIWYIIPHHLISRLTYSLTRLHLPFLVTAGVRLFIKLFKVDMNEAAETNPAAYPTFNAFFTRRLRHGARAVTQDPAGIACPADGRISQIGEIDDDRIFQAKGQDYSVVELLGGSESRATPFSKGMFCTLYLSPRDYHRVHMPIDGELKEMVYVPGRLFSVAPKPVKNIPRLFSRNERMAAIFSTEQGPMAVVMVGALNVAAIETVWAGLVTPPAGKRIQVRRYPASDGQVWLQRGQEMGRFNMGSTVIVLFSPGLLGWNSELQAQDPVKMGQRLGGLVRV